MSDSQGDTTPTEWVWCEWCSGEHEPIDVGGITMLCCPEVPEGYALVNDAVIRNPAIAALRAAPPAFDPLTGEADAPSNPAHAHSVETGHRVVVRVEGWCDDCQLSWAIDDLRTAPPVRTYEDGVAPAYLVDAAMALAEAVRTNEEDAEAEWTGDRGGCWFCGGLKCDVCQTLLPAFRAAEQRAYIDARTSAPPVEPRELREEQEAANGLALTEALKLAKEQGARETLAAIAGVVRDCEPFRQVATSRNILERLDRLIADSCQWCGGTSSRVADVVDGKAIVEECNHV